MFTVVVLTKKQKEYDITMKRKFIAAASVVMASAVMAASAYAADISIVIDGNEVSSDTAPQITAEGRTIVPLRVISEELGAKVDWDQETKTVTVEKESSTLKLTIGEKVMKDNDSEIQLDSPAQIVNDRTMVPLRAISESFGCEVDWDGETKTVIISTNTEKPVEEEPAEEKPAEEKPAEETTKTYKSKDGWSLKYDNSLVKVEEGKESVDFIYTGESEASAKVSVSYIKGEMPLEVLDKMTAKWDKEKTVDSEGFFAGDKWSFTRSLQQEEGSGAYNGYIAAEYNGGTVLVELVSENSDKLDENDTAMSDTIANIVDSVEFENAKPQTQFANIPGTYTRTYEEEIGGQKVEKTDKVTLNDDHSAVLSFQDEVEGEWRSGDILVNDYTTSYEYTVKDDILSLKIDDEVLEFTRETSERK